MDTNFKKRVIASILERAVRLLKEKVDWDDFARRQCYEEGRTMAFILIDDVTERPFARQDFGVAKSGGVFDFVGFDEPLESPTVYIYCTESMFLRIALKKQNPVTNSPWTPENAFWTTPYFYLVGENYFRDMIIFNRLFQEVSGIVDELGEGLEGD